jgi:Ca2+-binding EF-hand superfamily protein
MRLYKYYGYDAGLAALESQRLGFRCPKDFNDPLELSFPFEANSAAPTSCVGDCNNDHSVTVDEILTMVNIALGNADMSTCKDGDANKDGQITVDEILTAVNNALNGCGGG